MNLLDQRVKIKTKVDIESLQKICEGYFESKEHLMTVVRNIMVIEAKQLDSGDVEMAVYWGRPRCEST